MTMDEAHLRHCGPAVSLAVVLLAAGKARRMGSPKLLLPWGDTSILGHIIRQWQELGAVQIAVVLAKPGLNLDPELDRLAFPATNRIPNPEPEKGMFGSIQCAARWPGWIGSVTHWAVVLGDQPHLQSATLRGLLDCVAENPARVCQPVRGSRRRHPVVLPKALFGELKSTRAQTLGDFIARCGQAGFACDDPGLEHDIDTPQDYQKALAMAREKTG